MLDEFAEHEAHHGDDDAASLLPALAEVHRRSGRPDEAEQVARRGLEFEPGRSEPRIVLALALLDLGRLEDVRRVLEPLASALLARHGLDESDTPPPTATPEPEVVREVSDAELEEAFEEARPERENMLDADDVAQQAIRATDGDLDPEPLATAPPPFATHTVADLLESQGDPEAARQIRAAIEDSDEVVDRGRQYVIQQLEEWLENLRRSRS